jgi:hypothetical protein
MQTTNANDIHAPQRTLYGVGLVLGPLLLGLSTFFWNGEETGMAGGAMTMYSALFWLVGLYGLYHLIRPVMPRYAAYGALVTTFACFGFNNFGMEGIYMEVFRALGTGTITMDTSRESMGGVAPLVMLLPGILWPLSTALLGIMLVRVKAVPAWVGIMLCVGALSFPAGRVPRMEIICHITDLLLFIPAAWMGLRFLRGNAPEVQSEVGLSTT